MGMIKGKCQWKDCGQLAEVTLTFKPVLKIKVKKTLAKYCKIHAEKIKYNLRFKHG